MVDLSSSNLYEQVPVFLPGERLHFMNHGYARLRGVDHLPYLSRGERRDLPHAMLLHEILRSTSLANKDVLEVGCGRGGNVRIMARHFDARSVTGLDFSIEGIRFCKRVHRLERVSFVRGDAMMLPFGAKTFDVLLNIESSHCYPDRVRFYRQVWRVLRPGGKFCYADTFASGQAEAVSRVLSALGFEIHRQRDITKNVIRSIEIYGDGVRRSLLEASAKNRVARLKANELADSIQGRLLENYKTGRVTYQLWVAKKL